MDEPTNNSSQSVPRRKVHLSTWVFLAGSFIIGLTLNVPGRFVFGPHLSGQGKYGPHFQKSKRCEHGWPVTYSIRRENWVQDKRKFELSRWTFSEGIERFSVRNLLTDVLVVLALLVIGGILFEFWRRRRKHLFQFYLVEVLALTLLVALGANYLAAQWREHERELAILQAIDQTEDQTESWWRPNRERADWQQSAPEWLTYFFSVESLKVFDRVIGIDADGDNFKYVIQLKHLKRVTTSSVSNDQLMLLEQLPELEALDMMMSNLNEKPIFDKDGYEIEQDFRLPRLPNLRGLNLYQTGFRGEGLQSLPSLEVLDLTSAELGDAGLAKLSNARNMRDLSLHGNKITNSGMRTLAKFADLEDLYLGGNQVDDTDMLHLAKLPKLHSLDLGDTGITDASVPILKRFEQLKYLNLMETKITPQGLAELRQSLPKCHISP